MQREEINIWFVDICVKNTMVSSILGTIILCVLIIVAGWRLAIATGVIKGK